MVEAFKLLTFLVFFGPVLAEAQQDKMQHFSTGPKDVRKYLVALKHRSDSFARRQANEDRLRTFFGSTIYEMKNGSVVIFMGEGPEALINECSHDTAKANPFVKFVTNKTINFFCLSLYLPQLKSTVYDGKGTEIH